MNTKHCRRCDCTKPVADFASNPSKGDGLQTYCRQCQAEIRADWQERNREKTSLQGIAAKACKGGRAMTDAERARLDEILQADKAKRRTSGRPESEAGQAAPSIDDASAQIFPDISETDRAHGAVSLRKIASSSAIADRDAIRLFAGSASPLSGEGGGETTKENDETKDTSSEKERPPAEKTDPVAFGDERQAPATPTSDVNRSTAGIADLPHAAIVRSKTNPRTHFDQAFLDELAENVGRFGIMQPLIVRPLPADRVQETAENRIPGQPLPTHELIAGEQRWRAAAIAGLRMVPVRVMHLDDDAVLVYQLFENLKRRDLHPLEEAEGYGRLIERGHTVDEIATTIRKGRTYVYATLSLLKLIPEAREAFFKGDKAGGIGRSVAELLAGRTPELQAAILKDVTAADHLGDSMSFRKAREHIRNTYSLQLAAAPFKTDDAQLVPEAGPCQACPKRSGSNPDLFGDFENADTCTDPTCFGAKRTAHYAQLTAAAEARGQTVIVGKQAREIMPDAKTLRGYTRVDELRVDDGQGDAKPLRDVLGQDMPATTLVEHPTSHELIEVLPTAQAGQLLRDRAKAGTTSPATGPAAPPPAAAPEAKGEGKAPTPAPAPEPTKEQLADAYEMRWRVDALQALDEAMWNSGDVEALQRSLLQYSAVEISILLVEQLPKRALDFICGRERFAIGKIGRCQALREHVVEAFDDYAKDQLLLLAAMDLQPGSAKRIEALSSDLGIDLDPIRQRVRDDMKAEAAAKAPTVDQAKPGRKPKAPKATAEQVQAQLADAMAGAENPNTFKPEDRVTIRVDVTKGVDTFHTRGVDATVIEADGDRRWLVQPDTLNFPVSVDYTEIVPC